MVMIEMQLADSQALRAALDSFNVGVAIVGHDSSILHVNDAARSMLAEGCNILNRHGRLCAASRAATDELWRAIGLTRGTMTGVAANGIGVPLPGRDGDLATAHVLPLARADERKRSAAATAAVFIVQADRRVEPDLAVIAQSYRLTRAEMRLLRRLLLGETVMEAAASLKVAASTARTHVQNLLAKTGTVRQTQLIALVHRLVPPVHWGAAQRRPV
jgi:DNA-binding CsgD family transcriptional regulator